MQYAIIRDNYTELFPGCQKKKKNILYIVAKTH